ncbi:serine/threonine protein kinase [Corchorus capsularis]|uniref:Serine/threonine protein kinase n=1 Tax=Corchorus capsularis TaxID=210143 RepID=A0A1R3GD77_COCAP|nr:serine/threonine protein kinase [Corchorus capsularis]
MPLYTFLLFLLFSSTPFSVKTPSSNSLDTDTATPRSYTIFPSKQEHRRSRLTPTSASDDSRALSCRVPRKVAIAYQSQNLVYRERLIVHGVKRLFPTIPCHSKTTAAQKALEEEAAEEDLDTAFFLETLKSLLSLTDTFLRFFGKIYGTNKPSPPPTAPARHAPPASAPALATAAQERLNFPPIALRINNYNRLAQVQF